MRPIRPFLLSSNRNLLFLTWMHEDAWLSLKTGAGGGVPELSCYLCLYCLLWVKFCILQICILRCWPLVFEEVTSLEWVYFSASNPIWLVSTREEQDPDEGRSWTSTGQREPAEWKQPHLLGFLESTVVRTHGFCCCSEADSIELTNGPLLETKSYPFKNFLKRFLYFYFICMTVFLTGNKCTMSMLTEARRGWWILPALELQCVLLWVCWELNP